MKNGRLARLAIVTTLIVAGAAAPVQARAPYHWSIKSYICGPGTLEGTARIAEHGVTATSIMRIEFRLQSRMGGAWQTERTKSATLSAPEDGGSSSLKATKSFSLGADAGLRPHRIKFTFKWYEGEKGPIVLVKKEALVGSNC